MAKCGQYLEDSNTSEMSMPSTVFFESENGKNRVPSVSLIKNERRAWNPVC